MSAEDKFSSKPLTFKIETEIPQEEQMSDEEREKLKKLMDELDKNIVKLRQLMSQMLSSGS